MNLEDKLIDRLFQQYGMQGKNPQAVLDSPFFRDLKLSDKVRLIEEHKGDLSKDPRFNWSSVIAGTGMGALGAGSTVLLKQILSNGGKSFTPSIPGLVISGILGAAVGGAIQNRTARDEYNRDMATKKSVDDAINVLVSRSMLAPPRKENVLDDLRYRIRNLPVDMGHLASQMDWSVPPDAQKD